MSLRTLCYVIPLLALLPPTNLMALTQQKPSDATLGAKPPEGAVTLFNGEALSGWVSKDGKTAAAWPVADGVMTVRGGDIMTTARFGNFQLHVEFNVPYMPKAHGQGRGNSGVYLGGIHELQVLDS
jgi:hypothetical protein